VDPCKGVSAQQVNITSLLSDMHPGDMGTISHLRSNDASVLKKLLSMGLVPGRKLSVESNDGTWVITVGDQTLAIDSDSASSVYIDVCTA
jgi:Fe2+ transport system protein FeoA